MKKSLLEILIISTIIIGMFILVDKCENRTVSIEKIHKTEKRVGLQPINIKLPDPEIIKQFIYITEYDTTILPGKIDTVYKIVTDYLSEKSYIDSVLFDSNELIIISDTLYKNSIKTRTVDLIYNKQVVNNNGLFIGCGSALNFDHVNLSANVYYLKNRHLFGVGCNSDKQVLFTYGYRIK